MDNQPTSNLWTTRLQEVAAAARPRLQRRSPGWWRDEVAPGVTRADRVAALIGVLAGLDPTNEDRGAPPRPPRDQTLADQLAVVVHDLVREAGEDAHRAAAEEIATGLRDVDPRP